MKQKQHNLPLGDSSGDDIEIYIDGAARGNPGESGVGVLIKEGQATYREVTKYLGTRTNNQAEYTALITALESTQEFKNRTIRIFTDSLLMANQMNGVWKVRHPGIATLNKYAKELIKDFKDISITHIRRELNQEADRLANLAIDEYS